MHTPTAFLAPPPRSSFIRTRDPNMYTHSTHVTDRYTLALTHDGHLGTTKLYIDGHLAADCGGNHMDPSTMKLVDLFVGRRVDSEHQTLDGELGCLRMYSRALR